MTESLRALSVDIRQFVDDDVICGRIYADLHDMYHTCKWFVNAIDELSGAPLSRAEVESLMIKIEGHMLEHLEFHIRSLSSDMPRILENIGLPSADDENS